MVEAELWVDEAKNTFIKQIFIKNQLYARYFLGMGGEHSRIIPSSCETLILESKRLYLKV